MDNIGYGMRSESVTESSKKLKYSDIDGWKKQMFYFSFCVLRILSCNGGRISPARGYHALVLTALSQPERSQDYNKHAAQSESSKEKRHEHPSEVF